MTEKVKEPMLADGRIDEQEQQAGDCLQEE